MANLDLDSILDDALDEFDKPAEVPVTPARGNTQGQATSQQSAGNPLNQPSTPASSSTNASAGARTASTNAGTSGIPASTSSFAQTLSEAEKKELQELNDFLKGLQTTEQGREFFEMMKKLDGDGGKLKEFQQAMSALEKDTLGLMGRAPGQQQSTNSAPGSGAPGSSSSSTSTTGNNANTTSNTTGSNSNSNNATATTTSPSPTPSTATGGSGSNANAGAGAPQGRTAQFQSTVDDAIRELAQGAGGIANNPNGLPEMNPELEKMMEQLMSELGNVNPDDSNAMEKFMEKMMDQMLSKENLYQPIKDITAKYPEWLKENKSKVSSTEYENCEKQFDCFKRVLAAFDSKPDDRKKVMELMQEMQKYGAPPKEIVKDLLPPGMEFNDQGMPSFPGMGPGAAGQAGVGMQGAGNLPGLDENALKELAKNECRTQ